MLKEYRLTHRGILVADAAVASRFNEMNDPFQNGKRCRSGACRLIHRRV
jgi:hypothetical protein